MGKMSKIDFDRNNPIKVQPFGYCDFETTIHKTTYVQTGDVALVGRVHDTGEPAYTASVCIPDDKPQPGCVWIKTWSENEGILDALLEAGVISETTGRFARTGFTHAIECKLAI